MSENSEWDEIAGAKETTGGSYIDKPQVLIVTVTKCEPSPATYTKTPYFEVEFTTEDGRKNTNKFLRSDASTSAAAKEVRLGMIKSFFKNAGVELNAAAPTQIIGKKIKVLFREEEYIGKDANQNNKPVIKKAIKYNFSGPVDKDLKGNESHFYKRLSEAENAKFQGQVQDWARTNMSGTPAQQAAGGAPAKGATDDLPF